MILNKYASNQFLNEHYNFVWIAMRYNLLGSLDSVYSQLMA